MPPTTIILLSTAGSCQRCVFSREGRNFLREAFFRLYLPLVLKVYNRSFIEGYGFLAVDDETTPGPNSVGKISTSGDNCHPW